MVNLRRTQYTFLSIILVLYILAVIMTVAAGISLQISLIDNAMNALQVNYGFIQFASASNPYVLASRLLDAPILPLITVVFAAWFFDFINNMNIRERLVLSKIRKLNGHVIVVPYDGFAKAVLHELRESGLKAVTIVNSKRELAQLYRENELAVHGDLRSIETFDIAGIDKARCVIACSKDDVQNALICITAKAANGGIKIISRAGKEEDVDKLEKAGAYKIVLSDSAAGKNVGEEVSKYVLKKRMVV